MKDKEIDKAKNIADRMLNTSLIVHLKKPAKQPGKAKLDKVSLLFINFRGNEMGLG